MRLSHKRSRRLLMASSIKIACPECEHVHSLRTELLGRRLICVRCNHSFQARIAFPCPSCNYSLPLDLDKLGQQVSCTQCGHDFLAQVRLPCPECSRALKIRAGYIGHRIICKKCARVFRVVLWKEAPAAFLCRTREGCRRSLPASRTWQEAMSRRRPRRTKPSVRRWSKPCAWSKS